MNSKLLFSTVSIGSSGVYWFLSTEFARKEMLKTKFSRDVESFSLPNDHKYVEHPVLARDIRSAIYSKSKGVKIFWAPPGAGKTTTVRQVLKTELSNKNIHGAKVLIPPRMLIDEPDAWFRSNLELFGLETLKVNDSLSSLFHENPEKPYVIVIDQCDNLRFDDKMKRFIKSLAEDSNRTSKFVVLVICSEATKAATMKEWNGGVKIALIGVDHESYRWTAKQIDEWTEHYLESHQSSKLHGNSHLDHFKKSALVAGTPDFLITNTTSDENITSKEAEAKWCRNSACHESNWKAGQRTLGVRKDTIFIQCLTYFGFDLV
jgi:AAA domain